MIRVDRLGAQRPKLTAALFTVVLLGWASTGAVGAHGLGEGAATDWPVEAPGGAPIAEGIPDLTGLLFAGTSDNVNDPAATMNDVFAVDPVTGSATSILSGVQVWGATADIANQRILFTRASGLTPPPGQIGGGDELFAIPYGGGAATSLGRITDGTGEGFRIDGLAISGGVLYGVAATNNDNNGFYSIDMGTLVVTQISTHTDSIGGLDADPDTGIIYGTNDTPSMVVIFDPVDGTYTDFVAYPAGLGDIDAIAAGNGLLYLVPDRPDPIAIYDLGAGAYLPNLPSPFSAVDTFSGAAIAVTGGDLFTDGFESGDTTAWSSEQP